LKGQIKTAPIIYVNVLLCASLVSSTNFLKNKLQDTFLIYS